MEGIVALIMVFGMPIAIVLGRYHYRYKEKLLAAQQAEAPRQLEAAAKEKAQLEARLQNLESIVCSVDFELNQRLNRLTIEQSRQLRPADLGARPATDGHPAAVGVTLGSAQTLAAYGLGQLTPGQVVLDRYTVERELGRGGMGAVYLARDAKLGERVALKTIASLVAGDPEALVQRLRAEVQAARKITHPNVIRIHDLGEDGPLLFLSMEYVEGETVASRVGRVGPLPVSEARGILGDIAAGVAAAHAVGVVHRDLKPANVLLGQGASGRVVKVIDFGLAQASFMHGMTATGLIMGTPAYMAPEQIKGGTCTSRTDVYALGAIAYFVLCGRAPFVGDSPISIGFAQVHEPPTAPRELRPEIPESMQATILRSLAKDPLARFADASELGQALAAG